MAAKRCLPTNLFENPDFFELGSDTQVVLLGLVLNADDHGRGVAHSKVLARKFDKAKPIIEQALQELEANGFILCYEVEQQLYYSLCIWRKWQTLSKPTPSKYPAPPTTEQEHPPVVASSTDISEQIPSTSQDFPGEENLFQGNPGKSSLEGEEEGEGEEEEEQELKGEGEESPSKKVITFPVPASLCTSTTSGKTAEKNTTLTEITAQLASILQLPITDALSRLASEYQNDPSLSLLGEADAAREWIESPQKGKQQRMSIRFFRHWLNRERDYSLVRQKQREQHATTNPSGSGKRDAAPPPRKSLMGLSAQYEQQAALHQRSTGKEIQHG